MAVASKFALLTSSLTVKNWSPAAIGVLGCALIAKLYSAGFRTSSKSPKTALLPSDPAAKKRKKKQAAAVNATFFRNLRRIFKIIMPGVFSGEFFYMLLIAASLLSRTAADVYMITNATSIEASMVERNPALFAISTVKYALNLPLISLINALLKFGISELKLRFRERLTSHLYSKYLTGFTFL
ncbi:unnamed protein product [Caenorhabditis auriculariae]|uniref:ABC transmembrane type-1 domain-containing protein n=1 Tax=Caenorhabditis auriculariae TaxID=2777116 RepID=A0A8S1H1N3_9PELO|nr:unnamed protein product [Caenorhabditis auriculariae]